MKIVIGGIKGGTGKTTLAVNLAVVGHKLKKKILLVDADEQRSASDWAEQRGIADFPTIALSGNNVFSQIKNLEPNYDDIIIDAGGRDTTSLRSALSTANKFIVPFQPRSFDVWTLDRVKKLIEEIKTINPDLECFHIINRGDSRGQDNIDAEEIILSKYPVLKPLKTVIGNRKAFANAASDGKSVFEMPETDEKACNEVWEFASLIYHGDILKRSF